MHILFSLSFIGIFTHNFTHFREKFIFLRKSLSIVSAGSAHQGFFADLPVPGGRV